MADDSAIRLHNLRKLVKPWKPARAIELFGGSPSYWSDLLNGRKSFGEKKAREIEGIAAVPRGWLDQAHDDDAPVQQAEASPWPIKLIDRKRFERLPKHSRERVEMAMLEAIIKEELGGAITKAQPPALARKHGT